MNRKHELAPRSGLRIDLSVSKHRDQILIFASIVDSSMPTINMVPRIETTLVDDYCGAGGIASVSPTA